MGFGRDRENPYAGCRFVPKLILAGELDWEVAGRSSTVTCKGQSIVFSVAQVQDLRRLSRGIIPEVSLLGEMFERSGLKICVQTGWWRPIELFPNPSWLVKIMVPKLRQLA